MNPTFPITLAAVLLIGTTMASPVARVIETTKSLKAINATVECEVHRFPDDREWAHFKITWKPGKDPNDIPSSIVFAVFQQDGPHNDPGCGRMRVVFHPDQAGVVRAEFDVAVEELARSQVIFMSPQLWADILVLKTAADGYPAQPADEDPFAEPEKADGGTQSEKTSSVETGRANSTEAHEAGWPMD